MPYNGILSMPRGPHCGAYYSVLWLVISHARQLTSLGQAGCRIVTRPFFSGRVRSGHETNGTLSQLGPPDTWQKAGWGLHENKASTTFLPTQDLWTVTWSDDQTLILTDSRVIVTLIAKLLARLLNSYTLVTLLPPATGYNTPKEVPLLESCLQS